VLLQPIETALFSLDEPDLRRCRRGARAPDARPAARAVTVLFGNLLVNVLFFAVAGDLVAGRGSGYGTARRAWRCRDPRVRRDPAQVARAAAPLPVRALGSRRCCCIATLRPAARRAPGARVACARSATWRARRAGLTTEDLAEVLEHSAHTALIEGEEATCWPRWSSSKASACAS
jgi:hypothetical protein